MMSVLYRLEHIAEKPGVKGSRPVPPTKKHSKIKCIEKVGRFPDLCFFRMLQKVIILSLGLVPISGRKGERKDIF